VRRVLVVEDNEDAAESLRDLLDLCGYEVCVAYTGPEGVEAAGNFGPDVVLCDIGLPGCSGYEVAQTVLSNAGGAAPRLIAITGYGSPADRMRALDSGFEAHLVKPLDFEVLSSLLQTVS
jgi:CheY-like chemotaxis protein